jgi:hypothetical protein
LDNEGIFPMHISLHTYMLELMHVRLV